MAQNITSSELQAPAQAVGVFPQYCLKDSTTITISEKVLGEGGVMGFTIKDAQGGTILVCEGSGATGDERIVNDPYGVLAFKIRHKTFPRRFEGVDTTGTKLFEVNKKSFTDTPTIEAKFRNSSDYKEEKLELDVNTNTIRLNGQTVGHMKDRKVQRGNQQAEETVSLHGRWECGVFCMDALWFMADRKYPVTVAAGVDLAIIAALCLCYDEIAFEREEEGYTE